MSYSDDMGGPVGVGGWMYLFLFGFAGFTPLALLIGTYTSLYSESFTAEFMGSNWTVYQIYEWTLIAAVLAVVAYVTWRLFNVHNSATVYLTIAAILLLNIVFLLLEVFGVAYFAGVPASGIFSQMGEDFFRGIVYCAIWCTYFAVSKRVKNTYHLIEESTLDEVFE